MTVEESIGTASLDAIVDHLSYLYSRWQDERAYEDFDGYHQSILILNQGI
jgi:hypothetical protein